MTEVPTPSRPAPPNVPPVEHGGVRYEQDRFYERDRDQPGGYLAAVDLRTGERLWRIKVYSIAPKAPEGPEPMARYFRSLRLGPDGACLIVEDEVGGVYRVDLASHASVQLSGPPETAPAAVSSKPTPEDG
jgi:hypothetical protein